MISLVNPETVKKNFFTPIKEGRNEGAIAG
jgi:hypothetical protein